MGHLPPRLLPLILFISLTAGCATPPRVLMPTPALFLAPGAPQVMAPPAEGRRSTDVDLLYITDRGPETGPEATLPYGQTRARRVAFGSARVRIGPDASWDDLLSDSTRADRRHPLELSLGRVSELGRFPQEPYELQRTPDGFAVRDPADMAEHEQAKTALREELAYRVANSPRKEVVLYVHGFNETFASAAFTAAELCHFLGREPACAFFTWPASASGNFLTSYTNTTESAQFAVGHLKKAIRLLATTPGVERVQLLAHSRGSALLLAAVRELLLEAIAAGKDPSASFNIDNIVLFSPDIDVDVASQAITSHVSDPDLISVWPSGRLPRAIKGRLTVYSSPQDRALLVSRILFRSRNRVGNLRAEDIPEEAQSYLRRLGRMDVIIYEGPRTDAFGHSYFTTNPQVSSDVIQLLRYGTPLGAPGRELIQVGPIVWKFPPRPR